MHIPTRPAAVFRRASPSLTGVLLFAACLAGCLERNNPFDPLNQNSPIIDVIRGQNQAALDSLTLAGIDAAKGLGGFAEAFRADSLRNAKALEKNASRQAANVRTGAANDSIAAANDRATISDSLGDKAYFESLETLGRLGPYPPLEAGWMVLRDLLSRASAVMTQANEDARPIEVYPPAYRDSVLAPLRRDFQAFAGLRAVIGTADQEVVRANQDIDAYNKDVEDWNDGVEKYNSEIAFRRISRKRGILTHPDSLGRATALAKPGDTLLLGPGTFPVDLRFSSGTPENPVVIRGYPGGKTVLRPRDEKVPQAGIVNEMHIRFQDLVFRGGSSSGIKLSDSSRGVVFERCVFDSNGVWGVDAAGTDLRMVDCEVLANGSGTKGGGIRMEMISCGECTIQLVNVLVARNRGVGIEAVGPLGRIDKSTIADNAGDGLKIVSHQRQITVTNSIFSGNGGYGLNRDAIFENQEGLVVEATDFWANGETGDRHWRLTNLDSTRARTMREANLYLDPGFVDPPAFDYSLRPGSPVAAFENGQPVLIIGYRRKL